MRGTHGRERALGEALPVPLGMAHALILGLYLSLRGYHSFDGDQAYRLPLLLHWQDPSLYAADPFVKALDAFNPHRGWLIVMDVLTRPLGLSLGLFVLFVLTFLVTCRAIDRLARAVWPELSPRVGWVAVALVLAAKAGNIGTNHLFEAMVLDRLVALALGWRALAEAVTSPEKPWWRPAVTVGLATWVHPSVGLQLALVLEANWMLWAFWDRPRVGSLGRPIARLAGLALAVLPGLVVNLPHGATLLGGLTREEFWLLSVELQNPQHMLPHLWRMPQWMSWTCYILLAGLQLAGCGVVKGRTRSRSESAPSLSPACEGGGTPSGVGEVMGVAGPCPAPGPDHPPAVAVLRHPPLPRGGKGSRRCPVAPWPPARRRLAISLAVILAGLGVAGWAIEAWNQVEVTIFQPFRMATVARGMALVLIAGRLVALCRYGGPMGWLRATLLAVGFLGDWLLVVVTAAELAVSAVEMARLRFPRWAWPRGIGAVIFCGVLAQGLHFLGHHDTESGHIPLLGALGLGLVLALLPRRERTSYQPEAPANAFRRGPSIHSLARRACRIHFLAGIMRSRRQESHQPVRVRGRLAVAPTRLAALAAAWLVPMAALLAAMAGDHPAARHRLVRGLIDRCRLAAVPLDDLERLALWCREHTPATAQFIGPPGPKTFRLWSRRSLAFNRAASPYHGAGLADWFARFQEHVDFHGPPAEFVRAYLADRHRFEARYQALDDAERAALALRQGATYVVAAAPADHDSRPEQPRSIRPLDLLHVEGRYAVYRVGSVELVHRHR